MVRKKACLKKAIISDNNGLKQNIHTNIITSMTTFGTMDLEYNRTAEVLLIAVMPFLYGMATRLPFIYFVIHLDQHFGLDMLTIGFCVAMYQGARVATSALATKIDRVSHFMGTAIGLAGFVTVFVSDNDSLVPFVAGTAAVGFSETMSSMQ